MTTWCIYLLKSANYLTPIIGPDAVRMARIFEGNMNGVLMGKGGEAWLDLFE